jgi:putative flippase GtrA
MTLKTTSAGSGTSPPGRRDRRELGRVARFVVIGCASVAIDLAVYRLLAGATSPHAAKAVSYVAGMAVGFVGNKFWTFGSRRRSAAEPATYLGLYAVTLGVNVAANAGVLAVLPGETLFAFLAATGLTTVLNYLGLRLLTFRRGVAERDADVFRRAA